MSKKHPAPTISDNDATRLVANVAAVLGFSPLNLLSMFATADAEHQAAFVAAAQPPGADLQAAVDLLRIFHGSADKKASVDPS
jgi:hypothetical protein